jgi:hypothetical protein
MLTLFKITNFLIIKKIEDKNGPPKLFIADLSFKRNKLDFGKKSSIYANKIPANQGY